MLTRPGAKKRRTNYFGFGKRKTKCKKNQTLQKTKRRFYIIGIKPSRTQQKTNNNENKRVSVSRPCVNEKNRLMLGERKKKEKGEKQLVNKKTVLLGRSFLRLHVLRLI